MSNYQEFDNRFKYPIQSSNRMSQRTKSILTVIISVVVATTIIGILFSILMNQLINTTHHEINNKLGSSKFRHSIHSWLKNASEWINDQTSKINLTSVNVVQKNENKPDEVNLTNRTPLPFFGNNGNFLGRFMSAVGKAIDQMGDKNPLTTTLGPKIDSEGLNVYKLDVKKDN